MKKFIILCVLSVVFVACKSPRKPAFIGETEYQIQLNSSFKDASKSPLKAKDLRDFKGLDFFPVDSSFIVTATLVKTVDAPVFMMETTTELTLSYKEYGIVNFVLKGVESELTIYQSQDNIEDPKFKDDLFLPFTDNTTGVESYEGGRYMDLKITDENENGTIILNFNNTYNPYCVYNENYACPLTPRKNHVNVKVIAGIMNFKKDKK